MGPAAPVPTPPICVRGLSHHYGSKIALDALDFRLESGGFLALLGPNGAGKTTLFSLLTRLLEPRDGCIELFGHDLTKTPREGLRRMGVVFQQATLDLDLTVAQNLAYHGALHGMSPGLIRERSAQELDRFELSDRANDRVRLLNGGHRRRVEIARALLHKPQLLLLDEASAGLDLATRAGLYRHVRALCRDENLAVLWTTHLVEELDSEDATLVLHQGRIVARGTLTELQAAAGASSANATLLSLTGGARP